jgi:FixJ family two-component response regulator
VASRKAGCPRLKELTGPLNDALEAHCRYPTNAQAAKALGLTVLAYRKRREGILKRLGARSVTEAVVMALRQDGSLKSFEEIVSGKPAAGERPAPLKRSGRL